MRQAVQVRERGTITLPAELRNRHGIAVGDTFTIVELDGMLLLVPMVMMVPELAAELERARIDAGLSVEDLVAGVREQRALYHASRSEQSGEASLSGDLGNESS